MWMVMTAALALEPWQAEKVAEAEARLATQPGGDLLAKAIEAHGGMGPWIEAGTLAFDFDYRPLGQPEKRRYTRNVADLFGRRVVQTELGEGADAQLGWDGTTAWVVPTPESFPSDPGFWATTPLYFVGLPWVLADPGAVATELDPIEIPETGVSGPLPTLKITYEAGTGDAPDDFYVLHLHPKTHRVLAVRYIVTYPAFFPNGGHSPEKILLWSGHTEVDGLVFATHYDSHAWDGRVGEKKVDVDIANVQPAVPITDTQFQPPVVPTLPPLVLSMGPVEAKTLPTTTGSVARLGGGVTVDMATCPDGTLAVATSREDALVFWHLSEKRTTMATDTPPKTDALDPDVHVIQDVQCGADGSVWVHGYLGSTHYVKRWTPGASEVWQASVENPRWMEWQLVLHDGRFTVAWKLDGRHLLATYDLEGSLVATTPFPTGIHTYIMDLVWEDGGFTALTHFAPSRRGADDDSTRILVARPGQTFRSMTQFSMKEGSRSGLAWFVENDTSTVIAGTGYPFDGRQVQWGVGSYDASGKVTMDWLDPEWRDMHGTRLADGRRVLFGSGAGAPKEGYVSSNGWVQYPRDGKEVRARVVSDGDTFVRGVGLLGERVVALVQIKTDRATVGSEVITAEPRHNDLPFEALLWFDPHPPP